MIAGLASIGFSSAGIPGSPGKSTSSSSDDTVLQSKKLNQTVPDSVEEAEILQGNCEVESAAKQGGKVKDNPKGRLWKAASWFE